MRGLESESHQPLATVSLDALVTKNQHAIDTLIKAACSDGCFFLDLSDRNDLFTLADEVVEMADTFFDLPEEEKLLYEMDKFTNLHMGGYKAVGKHSGVKQGKKDAFENFLVPLNPLLGLDENLLPWPKVIHRHLDLFRSFEQECHRICQQILAALNNVLDETNLPFEENHRLQKPTTTALAMLKYPPSSTLKDDNAGHMAHTDVGSLTLLFTKSPGLQAFSEQTQSWLSVTPRPGSVIVNVGDALSFMSGQRLKSCLHRVVSMTNSTRFSLAYFQRPELDATFQDGDGQVWTGESWHRAKYKLFRADNEAQASSSLLTGRKNFLGHVDEQVRRRIAV